jgi:hypothetical protein
LTRMTPYSNPTNAPTENEMRSTFIELLVLLLS